MMVVKETVLFEFFFLLLHHQCLVEWVCVCVITWCVNNDNFIGKRNYYVTCEKNNCAWCYDQWPCYSFSIHEWPYYHIWDRVLALGQKKNIKYMNLAAGASWITVPHNDRYFEGTMMRFNCIFYYLE